MGARSNRRRLVARPRPVRRPRDGPPTGPRSRTCSSIAPPTTSVSYRSTPPVRAGRSPSPTTVVAQATCSAWCSDGASAGFSLITDECGGKSLAAGASCRVVVGFSPTVAGKQQGSVAFHAIGFDASATVLGEGITPGDADHRSDLTGLRIGGHARVQQRPDIQGDQHRRGQQRHDRDRARRHRRAQLRDHRRRMQGTYPRLPAVLSDDRPLHAHQPGRQVGLAPGLRGSRWQRRRSALGLVHHPAARWS